MFGKKILLSGGLLAVALAPAAIASAEEGDPTYSGIRLTSVTTDFDNLDRAINLGYTLGIAIPPLGNMVAAEIDLSTTLIPGENSGGTGITGGGGDEGSGDGGLLGLGGGGDGDGGGGDSSSSGGKRTQGNEDLRTNSVGIFLSGRTPGRFFGMARAGYRFMRSTVDELNEEQTGAAFTLGGGYRYDKDGTVELSYTQYSDEAAYLSLAVNF